MISILGATSWGTTLGLVLARANRDVCIITRSAEEADRLNASRQNPRLPGIKLPAHISHSADVSAVCHAADALILATPAQTMRANVQNIASLLPDGLILVNAAKGIEISSTMRMSQVIAEVSPRHAGTIATLSGPNLAPEISAGKPAATVIASQNPAVAERAQELIQTGAFRTYTNTDITGVELGGSLKNIIALVAGITDGLGLGDNAKASIITRGLAEIARLGVAAGANPLTFSGLAGLGDLIATCSSNLSRNHQVGIRLAMGESLDDILSHLGAVAEGVPTTRAARTMGHALGVELPLTEAMAAVLFEGYSIKSAVEVLLSRVARAEFA